MPRYLIQKRGDGLIDPNAMVYSASFCRRSVADAPSPICSKYRCLDKSNFSQKLPKRLTLSAMAEFSVSTSPL